MIVIGIAATPDADLEGQAKKTAPWPWSNSGMARPRHQKA